MAMKKEPTEEARLLTEMKQRGKEADAITKRANQLMKLGARTSEEQAELDRLMTKDVTQKRIELSESFARVNMANGKK